MNKTFSPQKSMLPSPLSQAQKGIWLGQQLDIKSTLYNAAEVVEIHGSMDEKLFRLSLKKALEEATALNVNFSHKELEPLQYLSSNCFILHYKDCSQSDNPFEVAMDIVNNQVSKLIDLEKGPLYYQELIKLSDKRFLWYQKIHHIVCDGYGFSLIGQRVAEIYRCLKAAQASPEFVAESQLDLGRPFGNYDNVLEVDRLYQSSKACQSDREFWLDELKEMSNPITLSQSSEPINSRSIRETVQLTKEQLFTFKNTCEQNFCTWADGLLSAVAYLVYRHTAAPEVVLGVPVAERMGTPALRVPAMVMNIVPLRVRFVQCMTLQDVMKVVASKMNQIRRHQRYRYEHLRRDLHLLGGDNRLFGPFVNIMAFDRNLEFNNKSAIVHGLSSGPVEDLSFSFALNNLGGIDYNLEANPNRYSLGDLRLYQKETFEILKEFNTDTTKNLILHTDKLSWIEGEPAPLVTGTVIELIQGYATQTPSALAVVTDEINLTYEQLCLQVNQLVIALSGVQIMKGDLVALALRRGEKPIVSCLACLMLGAGYVFVDPDGPVARNELILADAKPKVIVHHNDGDKFLSSETPQYFYDELFECGRQKVFEVPSFDYMLEEGRCNSHLESLAYVVYTSGSTGTPKGVQISQKSLSQFVYSASRCYGISQKDKVLQFSPLHFDASVEEIFLTLCNGATLQVRNETMLSSLDKFLHDCEQLSITVLDLPTAFWHELVFYCDSAQRALPKTLHTVIIGGESVIPDRVFQWHQLSGAQNIRLLNTYGPSEATVVATCTELKSGDEISIGRPLAGRKVVVVSRNGDVVPKGVSGELLLLGDSLSKGYVNLEALTKERFLRKSLQGLFNLSLAYCTGDLVKINEQNNIEYLGRIDEEVKISGHRINPLEVESAILSCTGIESVSVIVQRNNKIGKQLTAFVVMDKPLESRELRSLLSSRLPSVMVPSQFFQLESLPKSTSGKIDKKSLAQLMTENEDEAVCENVIEQQIVDVWIQVLGLSTISITDDFFMLGGQSLQTIQVSNRLSKKFNPVVPVTALFQYPTVKELAQFIADRNTVVASQSLIEANFKSLIDKDRVLLEDITPSVGKCTHHNFSKVLLTGSTGFVGVQLLCQILRQTQAVVYCLIRSASVTLAKDSLQSALLDQGLICDFSRVEVVLGDLEQEALGLSDIQFDELSSSMDAIFHNAANTSVMRDYKSLRRINVVSVQELLRCASYRNIPFHFVSTIAISPSSLGIDECPESFVPWHEGLQDGYQQTKWVAEELLKSAIDRGFDVSIYRLARVIGDLRSNYVNKKDLMWRILSASIRNSHFPNLEIYEPWTPVDIVSEVIVYAAIKTDENGVFNLVPESQVSLVELFSWLPKDIGVVSLTSLKHWLGILESSNNEEDKTILGFFQQRQALKNLGAMPKFQHLKSNRVLEKKNMHFPRIDKEIFTMFLSYAIEHSLIKIPNHSASAVENSGGVSEAF